MVWVNYEFTWIAIKGTKEWHAPTLQHDHSTLLGVDGKMAANKVFDLPELLEAILLKIPVIRVFTVIRVSKTFQATITTSGKLQRKMALQQLPANHSLLKTTDPRLNDFIRDVINRFSIWNPLIYLTRPPNPEEKALILSIGNYPLDRHIRIVINKINLTAFQRLRSELQSPWPSWADMYITDRPCKIVLTLGYSEKMYLLPSDMKIGHLIQWIGKHYVRGRKTKAVGGVGKTVVPKRWRWMRGTWANY